MSGAPVSPWLAWSTYDGSSVPPESFLHLYELPLKNDRVLVGTTGEPLAHRLRAASGGFERHHPRDATKDPKVVLLPTAQALYQENVLTAKHLMASGIHSARGGTLVELEPEIAATAGYCAFYAGGTPDEARDRLDLASANTYIVYKLKLRRGRVLVGSTNDLDALKRQHRRRPSAFLLQWGIHSLEAESDYEILRSHCTRDVARAVECQITAQLMLESVQLVRGASLHDVLEFGLSDALPLARFVAHYTGQSLEQVEKSLRQQLLSGGSQALEREGESSSGSPAGGKRFDVAAPSLHEQLLAKSEPKATLFAPSSIESASKKLAATPATSSPVAPSAPFVFSGGAVAFQFSAASPTTSRESEDATGLVSGLSGLSMSAPGKTSESAASPSASDPRSTASPPTSDPRSAASPPASATQSASSAGPFRFTATAPGGVTPAPAASPASATKLGVTPTPSALPLVTPAPSAPPSVTPAPSALPSATPAPFALPSVTPAPSTPPATVKPFATPAPSTPPAMAKPFATPAPYTPPAPTFNTSVASTWSSPSYSASASSRGGTRPCKGCGEEIDYVAYRPRCLDCYLGEKNGECRRCGSGLYPGGRCKTCSG